MQVDRRATQRTGIPSFFPGKYVPNEQALGEQTVKGRNGSLALSLRYCSIQVGIENVNRGLIEFLNGGVTRPPDPSRHC